LHKNHLLNTRGYPAAARGQHGAEPRMYKWMSPTASSRGNNLLNITDSINVTELTT